MALLEYHLGPIVTVANPSSVGPEQSRQVKVVILILLANYPGRLWNVVIPRGDCSGEADKRCKPSDTVRTGIEPLTWKNLKVLCPFFTNPNSIPIQSDIAGRRTLTQHTTHRLFKAPLLTPATHPAELLTDIKLKLNG